MFSFERNEMKGGAWVKEDASGLHNKNEIEKEKKKLLSETFALVSSMFFSLSEVLNWVAIMCFRGEEMKNEMVREKRFDGRKCNFLESN